MSKSLSFYTLKDSSGSTQLVAASRPSPEADILESMRQIPLESSILVEGEAKARPSRARRAVSRDTGADISSQV